MMNKKLLILNLLLATSTFLLAQSTGMKVYQILQEKCATCHSNANPQSGLDLEGAGTTDAQRYADVYNNIVDATPANTYAAGKGYDYIYKGRPDKSFLFRKANQGLEQTIDMHADEGGNMPPDNQPQLTDVEKEMIRQWVLYGAPQNGEVVDQQLIEDYYGGMGLASFETPPPAPDPSEGFQIKMGPFYLEPQGNPKDELEYFLKYELDLPEDVDVDRIDMKISPSSHHLIIYAFDPPVFAQVIDPGLRLEANHSAIDLVAAVQEATDLRLPETTAFTWQNDMILDLNSHYINYSAAQVLQAEAYINIYTKEAGSAEQEMKTALIVNGNIPIPNNANTITHTDIEASNSYGEIFVWGIMGHTHKYGTSYKVYKRVDGQQGEIIYDASCSDGAPGCVSPFFDYQHIPMLYLDPLMPMDMTNENGLIHEATWINDGPVPVNFGPTSDDEMMVLVLMYTEEQIGDPVSNNELTNGPGLKIYPNPMDEVAVLQLPETGTAYHFRLYDVLGKEVRRADNLRKKEWILEREDLRSGMYVYVVLGENGESYTGKILIE